MPAASNLPLLPDDILFAILDVADAATLARCEAVCRTWLHYIRKLYEMELRPLNWAEGRLDGMGTCERLALLRKIRASTSRSRVRVIEVSDHNDYWDLPSALGQLHGNILSQFHPGAFEIHLTAFPYFEGERSRTWSLHQYDTICYALDPTQDLFIHIILDVNDPALQRMMQICSLTTMSNHPNAAVPEIRPSPIEDVNVERPLMRIVGRYFVPWSRVRSTYSVWDWKTGEEILTVHGTRDAVLLTEDFLLSIEDQGSPHQILLVIYSTKERKSICRFVYPAVKYRPFRLHITKDMTTFSGHTSTGGHFWWSSDKKIIAIVGSYERWSSVLYVPLSTLTEHVAHYQSRSLEDLATADVHVIPWAKWGASTCMMIYPGDTHKFTSTHGLRSLVLLESPGSDHGCCVLYDFRKQCPGISAEDDGESDSPWVRVEQDDAFKKMAKNLFVDNVSATLPAWSKVLSLPAPPAGYQWTSVSFYALDRILAYYTRERDTNGYYVLAF